MKDSSGYIRYESVFQWMLPKFTSDAGEQMYFEFIAERMRNYMLHIIATHLFKLKYYSLSKCHTIQATDVARFYSVHMAIMIVGFPSIDHTWSS
jgi:hypothetical protein